MNPFIEHKIKDISHILHIFVNNKLCDIEKNIIISSIYDKLNEKQIIKNILGIDFLLIWKVSEDNDLLHYYTNGNGLIMSDKSVYLHIKLVLSEIKETIGKDKFSFTITRPITEKVCII
jgi:hypothetical protein